MDIDNLHNRTDTPTERLGRRVLANVILLTCGFGVIWSILMMVLGLQAAAANTIIYVALSMANLAYLRFTGRYAHSRTFQITLILLNPLTSHIVFGGFVASGVIILSGFIAPVGALMFHSIRAARLYFGLFVAEVILGALLEAGGYVLPANPTPGVTLVLFAVNIPMITVVMYVAFEYFTKQRGRLFEVVNERNAELSTAIATLQETQQQLIHAEKMASLGALTAGIAHEIKNPLNFINNFAEVNQELIEELRELVAEGAPLDEVLDDLAQGAASIKHHGYRADRIVQGMMQHARGGSGEREAVVLDTMVSEYVELAYHGKRAQMVNFDVAVEKDLQAPGIRVHVVPQEMGRVFLNLLTNAFDSVNTYAKQAGPDYRPSVRIATRRVNATVEIYITDNGPGVPADLRDRIFEPFFTTKATGSGTGLGLSLSYDIVTQGHGGILKLLPPTSERGATFVVILAIPQSQKE